MDQHVTPSDFLDAGHQGPASAETSGPVTPLRPVVLVLSTIGIAGAAVLLCCLVAVIALLILVADVGIEGASDLYQDLRFDSPLKTQISVFVVSALYLCVACTTFAAAAFRGRRSWASLLALTPVRRRGEALLIAAVTLAYIGLATYALEHTRDGHLLVSGQTDFLLVGSIVFNLVVLAPVAEEMLFRGWLYTGLRARLAFWPSFLVTVVLFASIHFDANHRRILQVLPLAFALGLLRERTGSIKPTIALHAVYNLIIIAIRLAYT